MSKMSTFVFGATTAFSAALFCSLDASITLAYSTIRPSPLYAAECDSINMEFLVAKWKIWYKSLDVNHDGTISIEDVEESRSKFSELHNLDAEKKKYVSENFEDWWNEYIFRGVKGEISETQFIANLTQEYTADKDAFVSKMERCFDKFFDVIDTNKDRSIDEDEFLIAFKAYGHENVAKDTKFFKAYNPKNDMVPLKEIVKSWVEFTTSNDASKRDVVKEAFDAGV